MTERNGFAPEKDVDEIVNEAASVVRQHLLVTDVTGQDALNVLCQEIERLREIRDGK